MGSCLVADEWMDLRRGAKDDVIVTDARRSEEMITMNVTIDNQRAPQLGDSQACQLHWQRAVGQGRTILAEDFNGHSSR
jgi:hypothetical protein